MGCKGLRALSPCQAGDLFVPIPVVASSFVSFPCAGCSWPSLPDRVPGAAGMSADLQGF